MSTPVIRGRMITDDDTESAPPVVAINETLARKYFSGVDPLGMRLDLGGKDTGMTRPLTIVGVIGDQVDTSAAQPARPLLMIPYRQIPTTSLFYQALVKTVVNLAVKTRVTSPSRRPRVRSSASWLPTTRSTMCKHCSRRWTAPTSASASASISRQPLPVMATMMVIAGLYGVLAQVITYRRREFGIRLALGATPSGIVAMVLRQAAGLIAIGLTCGIAAAVVGWPSGAKLSL